MIGRRSLGLLPLVAAGSARAQSYPSRPITIVVPYGPGSSTDNIARPVARALQEVLRQPVVAENRGGANGVIGTQYAARARADGHTLLIASSTTMAANVGLFRNLPYDPARDFVPVAGVAQTSMLFVVPAEAPARTIATFLDRAREGRPPPIAYGSSSAQVALALLGKVSGIEFTGVPYRDTPQVLTDLMGGQIAMGIVDVGNAVPYLRDGKLRGLVMSGASRSAFAPDVPTMAETWPGTSLVTWIGLVAPAGTPAAIVQQLDTALAGIMARPDIRQQFQTMGTDIEMVSHQALAERLPRDQAQLLELIRLAGIEPQ